EVNAAGDHDLLDIGGRATLDGGEVAVHAANGNYDPQTDYTILKAAGGVNGQFDSVSANLVFLDPALAYDPNAVILTLTRNDIDFAAVATTHNQRAAARGAGSLALGSDIYNSLVTLDTATARTAYDALSGEFYASRLGALLDDSRYTRDAVSSRLDRRCAGAHSDDAASTRQCAGSAWLHPYGDWGHTRGDGNAARLKHDVSGFYLGADKVV